MRLSVDHYFENVRIEMLRMIARRDSSMRVEVCKNSSRDGHLLRSFSFADAWSPFPGLLLCGEVSWETKQ